ncbi:unnamed protein product [Arctogadus glacialis]
MGEELVEVLRGWGGACRGAERAEAANTSMATLASTVQPYRASPSQRDGHRPTLSKPWERLQWQSAPEGGMFLPQLRWQEQMGGGSGLLCLRKSAVARTGGPPTVHPGPRHPRQRMEAVQQQDPTVSSSSASSHHHHHRYSPPPPAGSLSSLLPRLPSVSLDRVPE